MQKGRICVHWGYVLYVHIFAPSEVLPDWTFYSVGVNSCTKSRIKVNVLFVHIFAPPGWRGEYVYKKHVYLNPALCTHIRPSWKSEPLNVNFSGNYEACTRIHTSCMWVMSSGEVYICMKLYTYSPLLIEGANMCTKIKFELSLLFVHIFAPPGFARSVKTKSLLMMSTSRSH